MSDIEEILWDILTSFDMHGATATKCAGYIMSPASGLALQLVDQPVIPARNEATL